MNKKFLATALLVLVSSSQVIAYETGKRIVNAAVSFAQSSEKVNNAASHTLNYLKHAPSAAGSSVSTFAKSGARNVRQACGKVSNVVTPNNVLLASAVAYKVNQNRDKFAAMSSYIANKYAQLVPAQVQNAVTNTTDYVVTSRPATFVANNAPSVINPVRELVAKAAVVANDAVDYAAKNIARSANGASDVLNVAANVIIAHKVLDEDFTNPLSQIGATFGLCAAGYAHLKDTTVDYNNVSKAAFAATGAYLLNQNVIDSLKPTFTNNPNIEIKNVNANGAVTATGNMTVQALTFQNAAITMENAQVTLNQAQALAPTPVQGTANTTL